MYNNVIRASVVCIGALLLLVHCVYGANETIRTATMVTAETTETTETTTVMMMTMISAACVQSAVASSDRYAYLNDTTQYKYSYSCECMVRYSVIVFVAPTWLHHPCTQCSSNTGTGTHTIQ